MAMTYSAITSINKGSVFGNMRVNMGTLTLDATGGSSTCGLKVVRYAMVTPQTTTSSYAHDIVSSTVVIYSGTTADKFNVMAFGD
jgi:hypothetical protein